MRTCPTVKVKKIIVLHILRDQKKTLFEVLKLLNSIVVKSKEKFHTAIILRFVGA